MGPKGNPAVIVVSVGVIVPLGATVVSVVLAAAAIAGLVPADSAVLAPVVTVVLVPVAIAAPVLRVPLVAALESPGTRRVLPVAMDRDAARAVRTSARSR